MDLKELVKLITKEVIEILEKKQGEAKNKKKVLIFLSGSKNNLTMSMPQVKKIIELGHDVKIVVDKDLLNVYGLNSFKDMFQNAEIFEESTMSSSMIEESHIIVLPSITIKTVGEIVNGIFSTYAASMVILGLFNGKRVIASRDNLDWGLAGKWDKNFHFTNEYLSNMIQDNMMKLQNIGINLVDTNSLAWEISEYLEHIEHVKNELNGINHFYQLPVMSFEEKHNVFSGKLVTVKEVDSLEKTGECLLISEKTIVTPLARDKANEIGLKIRRVKS